MNLRRSWENGFSKRPFIVTDCFDCSYPEIPAELQEILSTSRSGGDSPVHFLLTRSGPAQFPPVQFMLHRFTSYSLPSFSGLPATADPGSKSGSLRPHRCRRRQRHAATFGRGKDRFTSYSLYGDESREAVHFILFIGA
jgi:hypothetical protein